MKGHHGSPEREQENQEPREIRALRLHVEIGEEVMEGKRIFGDTIRDDLMRELPKAKKVAAELGQLEDDALRLIDGLPGATVMNCQTMAAKCEVEGDKVNAQLWREEANKRLVAYRKEKRALHENEIAERRRAGDEEGAERLQRGLDEIVSGWNDGLDPSLHV